MVALTPGERAAIQLAAEYYYINDVMGQVTLVAMARLPQFAHIRLRTLEEWAQKRGWIAQRRSNQDRIRRALEARLGDQLVEQTASQLEQMQRLYDRAMGVVMGTDGPEPRTWEGVASLTLKLGKHMAELRQGIAARLTPEPEVNPDEQALNKKKTSLLPKESLPQLTPEEARLVAHQLMRMRQLPGNEPAPVGDDPEGEGAADDSSEDA